MNAPLVELTSPVVKDLTGLGIKQVNINYLCKEVGGRLINTGREVVYTAQIIAN